MQMEVHEKHKRHEKTWVVGRRMAGIEPHRLVRLVKAHPVREPASTQPSCLSWTESFWLGVMFQ